MNIVIIFSEVKVTFELCQLCCQTLRADCLLYTNLDESPAFLEPFSPRKREKQRAPPGDRDDEPLATPGPRVRGPGRAESGVWHKEPESRGSSRALGLRRQESEGVSERRPAMLWGRPG